MAKGTKQVNISAVTGKYVSATYAAKHPRTVVTMTVKKGTK